MDKQLVTLETKIVHFIPDNHKLEPGKLYISRKYSTAVHLCPCGCGMEVVTPLKPMGWELTETDGLVSLNPSIGNQNFPCQSHYWIKSNRVIWAT